MRSARPARRLRVDDGSLVDIDESLRMRLPFVDIELPLSDEPDDIEPAVPDDIEPDVPDDIDPAPPGDVVVPIDPDELLGAVVVLPGDDRPEEPEVLGDVVVPVAPDGEVPMEPEVEPVEPGVVPIEPDDVPGVVVPMDGDPLDDPLPVPPAVPAPVEPEVLPPPAAGSALVEVPGFDIPGLPVVPVAGPGVIGFALGPVEPVEPVAPVEPLPEVLVCASTADEPTASDKAAARPRREGVRGFMVDVLSDVDDLAAGSPQRVAERAVRFV